MPLTSVPQARDFIISRIVPITDASLPVPLPEARGRILAQDTAAPFNIPGHDNSAMDGFACRLADLSPQTATNLRIAGTAYAGAPFLGAFSSGECVKIMTGAVLPPEADIVIPKEETTLAESDIVAIHPAPRKPGTNTRKAGEDLRKGETALPAGTLLGAAEIGLLASLGLAEAKVFRKLRVAHFSTGDELRTAGEPLGAGEVYDSNRRVISAMLSAMNAETTDLGVIPDDRAALAGAFDAATAAKADAIITSGGASVGEADYIREILSERGEALFWKVAMRPGRPLAYGKVGAADFFGLPGNPVSVMVCFCQFVRPALWRRAGRTGNLEIPMFEARAAGDLRKSPGRMEFQRGVLRRAESGEWLVASTGDQGSGILSSMTRANCFIVLEESRAKVAKGDPVLVQPFEGILQ